MTSARAATVSRPTPSIPIPHGRREPSLRLDDSTPSNNHRQPHKTTETDNRPLPSNNVGSMETATAGESSELDATAGAEEDGDEDGVEEDDQTDEVAPPHSADDSSQPQGFEDDGVWAGLQSESFDEDGEFSDSESGDVDLPFELNEDDDDYDALDRMSVTSDDSKKFENDIEQEILAAGEDGIDWDNEDTYGYTVTSEWRATQYYTSPDLLAQMPMVDGFSIFDYDLDEPPVATAASVPSQVAHQSIGQPQMMVDWPSSSSSASDVDDLALSRRISQVTAVRAASVGFQTESGYDTDDDENGATTITAPSVALAKSKTPSKAAEDRRITDATPPRVGLKGPVLRRLNFVPKTAIAYAVPTSRGKIIQFRTPKGSKLEWVKLRRRRESSSEGSSPSSPTMIDLEAALEGGNTRTGAVITDVIHGRLFRQYHCNQPADLMVAESSAMTEFARVPFLNTPSNFRRLIMGEDLPMEDLYVEDASDLIDFDGGLSNEVSSAETPQGMEPLDSEMNDVQDSSEPGHDRKGKGKAVLVPETPQIGSSPQHGSSETPYVPMDLTSSPLKKRAADEDSLGSLASTRRRLRFAD